MREYVRARLAAAENGLTRDDLRAELRGQPAFADILARNRSAFSHMIWFMAGAGEIEEKESRLHASDRTRRRVAQLATTKGRPGAGKEPTT